MIDLLYWDTLEHIKIDISRGGRFFLMQIGEVIRKNRLDKNMTQEEMARRLGVTASAVKL